MSRLSDKQREGGAAGRVVGDKFARARRLEIVTVHALFLTNCIAKSESVEERQEMMAVVREHWAKVSGLVGVPRELV